MTTNKRFYIESGIYDPDPIADEEEFCFIRDSTTSKRIHQASYRITDEVNYLDDLCDLLNKGHETTEAAK